jgi:hypothetical protein
MGAFSSLSAVATEIRINSSIGVRPLSESAVVVFLCIIRLTVSSLMGPKMDARQQLWAAP